METLWQDVRYGVRVLFRSPRFSLFVVLLVAVGVGGSTAVFSVVNAFLIRPLPYEQSDRIVFLRQRTLQGDGTGVSYLNYLDWRRDANSFEELGCYCFNSFPVDVPDADLPEICSAGFVSSSFLPVLGVTPRLGRLINEEDDRASAKPVVMISYPFWQRHFAADPDVVGKSIAGPGFALTVIGVMPRGFRYPAYGHDVTDLWVPIGLQESRLQDRASSPDMYVLGRLSRGVSMPQARTEMDTISARLAAQYPAANGNTRAEIEMLSTQTLAGKERACILMMFAVGFLFLVACVNVAGLLFARGVAREPEMAIRASLGAARLRLLRQMFVEDALLALAGGLLGTLGAAHAVRLLARTDMIVSMRLPEGFLHPDGRVLGFALAVTILAIPLFGLLPSVVCSRTAPARGFGSESRNLLGSRGRYVIPACLIGIETALTVVLLVAAGLMVRSFVKVATADPGFDSRDVLTMNVALGTDAAKHQELLDRTRALPGVKKAALSFPLFTGWKWYVCAEGHSVLPTDPQGVLFKAVSSGYFEAMGIRLLQGRTFDERDHGDSQPVAIVNEDLARRYWPRGDAIGKRIQYTKRPDPNAPWIEIIGVVAPVKNAGVETGPTMEAYRPLLQKMTSVPALILRTEGKPERFAGAVKDIAHQIEPRYPVTNVQTLDQIQSSYTVTRRMNTSFLTMFAAVALFLSTAGIYAITRYAVSRRTQEFGIRVALGADRNDLLRLVFRRGLTPVVIGTAAGLAGAIAVARMLSSLLFQLSPWDPTTYAVASLFLILAAALASYLPARHAARIDPMEALRYE